MFPLCSIGEQYTNDITAAATSSTEILQHGSYVPDVSGHKADAQMQNDFKHQIPTLGNSDAPVGMYTSARNIYRCLQGKASIYVDEKNMRKFQQCRLIQRGKEEGLPVEKLTPPEIDASTKSLNINTTVGLSPSDTNPSKSTIANTCSGTILYQGKIYIFYDSEICPIPQNVFESRRPLDTDKSNDLQL